MLCSFLNRFYFLRTRFTAKLSGKYRDFPYVPRPTHVECILKLPKVFQNMDKLNVVYVFRI